MTVNYLSILTASMAGMVWGIIWYGPLFGKVWMKLQKKPKKDASKKAGMEKVYLVSFLSTVLTAWVLTDVLSIYKASSLSEAWGITFKLWLGFVVPIVLGGVLWLKKALKVFYLDASFQLTAMLAMAWVLMYWM